MSHQALFFTKDNMVSGKLHIVLKVVTLESPQGRSFVQWLQWISTKVDRWHMVLGAEACASIRIHFLDGVSIPLLEQKLWIQ